MRFHAGLDLEWTVSELKDTLARIAWMDRKTERLCADLKVCALAGCLQCEDEIRAARQHLNELNVQILSDGQKDKKLVHLFRRAHQNFACLFPAQSGEVQLKPYTHLKRYFQEPAFRTPEIHLTLDVHASYVEVSSDLTVQRVGKAGPLILDGQGHEVLEVKLNGTVLGPDAYRATQNELILLKTPSEPNFQVTVRSRIDPYSNDSMEGLYVSGGALVSQCEAVAARKIFFTIDEPANRSIITTTLIADPEKYPYRLSNGNLVADTKLEDGRCQTTWFDPHSKPSYIFGVVMGDFDVREASFTTRSGREVKLQCYSEKGKGERSEYSLWALQKSMQFDEEFYDLEYDLDTMIMVAVADFNAGAMENKGLMLFNESSLLVDSHTGTDGDFMSVATTVMHEYAHNWSGNRVTVKHFFEAALKEAFTDKRAQQFGEWLFGKDLVRPDDVAFLQDGQFPEDASADKAHPVNGDAYIDANELYDYTTYIKGRELFRLLEALLDRNGKGTFRKAQSHYFQKCDGDSVTFDQFVAAMEEGSQQDLSLYRRWFEQAGTPEVNVKLDWSKEGEVVLHLSQHCLDPRSGKEHKPFQIPFPVQLITASGKLLSPTTTLDFSDREKGTKWIVGELEERPIPVMLHDYTAPIRLNYSYTEAELVAIIRYTDDAYVRGQA
ncbi:MAG: DUF3458 domain-containing protein, partial [Chlamydiia bacterium]|nr:DUF3458 domain-containing protein [Chlamydiia bacterium]